MAVAAHRGMENPFSGSTRVGPRAHLSAAKQERRLSVTADPQSATRGTRWEGKRLEAAQISMKINRWLTVNHRLSFPFFSQSHHASLCSPSSFTQPDNPAEGFIHSILFFFPLKPFSVSSASSLLPSVLRSSVRCSSPLPHTA